VRFGQRRCSKASFRSTVLPVLLSISLLGLSELSWAQLPHYALQSRINSCGAAALAAVLQSLGYRSLDEHDLWQWAQQDYRQKPIDIPASGLSLADLKRLSHRVGVNATGVSVPVDALPSLPTPAIIRLTSEPLPHFVVLWQLQGQVAQVFDPAIGNHWVEIDSLIARNRSTGDELSALIVATVTPDEALPQWEPPATLE
jgi:ABC-type bacteriocin/lantibiotic exporter with double-glycine peptidase domain